MLTNKTSSHHSAIQTDLIPPVYYHFKQTLPANPNDSIWGAFNVHVREMGANANAILHTRASLGFYASAPLRQNLDAYILLGVKT